MGVNDVDNDLSTNDAGRLRLAGMGLAIERLASSCSPEIRTALASFLTAATDTKTITLELASDARK